MQPQPFLCSSLWIRGSLALLLTLVIGFALTQPALAVPVWQSQPDTPTPTDTPAPPTDTPAPPTDTPADIPVPPTATPTATLTNTPAPPTATPTATPSVVWQIKTLDSVGDVGEYTALALDSNSYPIISYYDVTNGDLKLLRCGNPTCGSSNIIQTLDSAGDVGLHTALALDGNGNPVISYLDSTNRDLKLVHCNYPTCSSGNTFQAVDRTYDRWWYMSLALDSSGRPVISYYDYANGDLKLARCGNATCSGNGNTTQTLDSAGYVGQYTSLALDSSGNPVISYYDATNGDLKLVHCGNATCSSGNVFQTVDSVGTVGRYTSLALDSNGNPVISYHDVTNSDLKLVHCGNATCSSGNVFQTVDGGGNVGEYTSLALTSSGNPVISYYAASSVSLKLAQCGNATCTASNTIQTVDNTLWIGKYTSLALDSSGKPVISYYDVTNRDLKLARLVDRALPTATPMPLPPTPTPINTPAPPTATPINASALSWQIKTLESAGAIGQYTSLALNSTSDPVISYYDATNGDLKLLYCGNPTCSNGNVFQTVDSAGNVGQYTSLALDSSGNPVISYYDATNGDLKLARCGNPICSSGNSIQTVDSVNNVGQYLDLALDGNDNPVISYYDATSGDLKLARCGTPTCSSGNSIQAVDSGDDVGKYTSLALDSSGKPIISYYDVTNRDLNWVHCGNLTCTVSTFMFYRESDLNMGQHLSLALDSTDTPFFAFLHIPIWYNYKRYLALVHCDNSICSSGKDTLEVDIVGDVAQNTGNVALYTSLVLDGSGRPVISYHANNILRLLQCGNTGCNSGNVIQTVDSTGNVGEYTSLALDSRGRPVISYYDATNGDLKLARWIDPTQATTTLSARAVVAWGSNTGGESSAPAELQAVAVAGGRWHSLALKSDGTVVAWGCTNGYGAGLCTVPAGLSGVTAIAAGPYHNLALKSDGTVVAWGCGTANYGQCTVPAGLSGVKAVAAGIFRSVALKNDGTVVVWGCGAPVSPTPCTIPAGLSGVKAIAAGVNHTLALKNDGTVVGWGINSAGETNGATAGSGVIAIAAAGSHSLALKSNGTVVAWGDNAAGQNNIPAGLSGVMAIAAGGHHSLAQKNDGTVVAWGCGVYNNGQCTVPTGLSGVIGIGAGHLHSLALAAGTPAGGVAASAVVSTDAAPQLGAAPTLEGFSFITESAPANAPDAAVTADVTVAQNQRLFLPLVANDSTMAASDSAPVVSVTEAARQSAAVTTTTTTTLTLTAVDPNAGATQPVTRTAPATVVTASVPVSAPVAVEAAPVITESAPAAVEAAPVVTASVPVSVPTTVEVAAVVTESVPTAVEALPAVTDTLLLTTTQPITPDGAANPLAGTAVGSQGGIVVLLLVGLAVAGSLVWQRRRSRPSR